MRFLGATADLSPEKAAEMVEGISGPTIRRYRDGRLPSRLTSETRLAMKRFLATAHDDSREETPEQAAAESLQWVQDFERTVRYVGGREDLDPEERRARQRDLVNGMIQARKERGADVPAALYALLGRLESGDL